MHSLSRGAATAPAHARHRDLGRRHRLQAWPGRPSPTPGQGCSRPAPGLCPERANLEPASRERMMDTQMRFIKVYLFIHCA